MSVIEEKKNKLNFEIRSLLSIIDLIDGKKKVYNDYKINTLTEEEYLNAQLDLIIEAKNRLINIFKD